ncbi:MAG TPA: sensor histidine kinase [Gammaproteobacteria bacterium]|jgi:two-component system sensor histidine kinase DesK|nr:sensor histidine kinase [Gammaproteobacteria bacterium]
MQTAAPTLASRLARPLLAMHRRLLPNADWAGWTPYLWLLYLGFFFVPWPGMEPWDTPKWVFSIAAALIFMVMYFRSFSCQRRELHRILAGITTLGYIFVIYTGNGHTFIIYACALSSHYGNLRRSLTALGLILIGFTLEATCLAFLPGFGYSHTIWFWLPTFMIGGIIGAANAWFADDEAKRRVISQSQEEIRRLAATAERERIARDLHDLLGHTLTLITVKAELAARLAERNVAAAAKEVRELESISRDALRQVREAVGGYRNGGLNGELVNARVALDAARVELAADVDARGCPATHDNLFALVLREAVTNILRHSGARRCSVELLRHGMALRLNIRDDGRGGNLREGNGLRGMRERLAALDGSLYIESDRNGTLLTAVLPLPQLEDAPEAPAGPLRKSA